jgi:U3 small nucleolar RNA-associated protein 25
LLCRGAVKLFSDFFDSDIIVASPLALATRLAEGGGEEGGAADFLSSVEIALVERADMMLMQNWAHVATGGAAGCGVRWGRPCWGCQQVW